MTHILLFSSLREPPPFARIDTHTHIYTQLHTRIRLQTVSCASCVPADYPSAAYASPHRKLPSRTISLTTSAGGVRRRPNFSGVRANFFFFHLYYRVRTRVCIRIIFMHAEIDVDAGSTRGRFFHFTIGGRAYDDERVPPHSRTRYKLLLLLRTCFNIVVPR